MLNPLCHSVFASTKDPKAAKDFLRWLMAPKQAGPCNYIAVTYYQPFLHAYYDAPMWKVEPRNLPYRDALKTAHLPGGRRRQPGRSRRPSPSSSSSTCSPRPAPANPPRR